jgi:signal peptidase
MNKRKLLIFSLILFALFIFIHYSPRLIIIASSSMKPSLAPGDLALTTNVDPREIRVGDVIVYRKAIPFSSIEVVVHRVMEVKTDGYIYTFKTKGDANPKPDPWDVTPKEVFGKVFWVVPNVGWLLYYVRANLISIILMSVGLGLVLLYIQPVTEEERSSIKCLTCRNLRQKTL